MNPKLIALFHEYAEAHRHPTNQLTHKIAIPLIVFHIIAMLDWVALVALPGGFVVTLAMPVLAAAAVWYLRMSPKLGVLMVIASIACIPLGRLLPGVAVIAIAAAGWLIQLAGHVVWEKKSPSFLTNLVHALVGPVFFIAKLTGDWPAKTAAAPAARAA